MIEKTYYVGQFGAESALAGFYFMGIHRSGEGTLPFDEKAVNGVKNNISGRHLSSFDVLRGYLIAIMGEFQFEGTDVVKFQVDVKNWSSNANKLFKEYLHEASLPPIVGLSSRQVKDLGSIVGLTIKEEQPDFTGVYWGG